MSAYALTGIPVWATLGNERFGLVSVPESVTELHLFVDHDAGGELAASRGLAAYAREGRTIHVRKPSSATPTGTMNSQHGCAAKRRRRGERASRIPDPAEGVSRCPHQEDELPCFNQTCFPPASSCRQCPWPTPSAPGLPRFSPRDVILPVPTFPACSPKRPASGLGKRLDHRRLQQRGRDRRTALASRVLTHRSGDKRARSRSAFRLARSSLAAAARSQRSTGRAPAVLDPADAGLADGEGRSSLCARHAARTVRRQWRPCALGQRPERLAAPQRDRSGKTRQPGPHLPFGHDHCARRRTDRRPASRPCSVGRPDEPAIRPQPGTRQGRRVPRSATCAVRSGSAASGARIVAIMPDGFDASTFAKAQDEASLLLNVRLQQMFRRTGTGIAVRLVVFDKTPTASSPAITGDTCDLIAAPRAYHRASATRADIRQPPSPASRQASAPRWQDFDPTRAGPAGRRLSQRHQQPQRMRSTWPIRSSPNPHRCPNRQASTCLTGPAASRSRTRRSIPPRSWNRSPWVRSRHRSRMLARVFPQVGRPMACCPKRNARHWSTLPRHSRAISRVSSRSARKAPRWNCPKTDTPTAKASSSATGPERARDGRSQRSSWIAGSPASVVMSGSPRTRRCSKMRAATGKRLAGCRSISSRSRAGNSAIL